MPYKKPRFRRPHSTEEEKTNNPQPSNSNHLSLNLTTQLPLHSTAASLRQNQLVGLQQHLGNQAVQGRLVQRRSDNEHVGGEGDQFTFLSHPSGRTGETLAPGEAGYSRRMLMELPGAAELTLESYEDMMIPHVAPDFSETDEQLRHRASEVTGFKEQADDFFNLPHTTAFHTEAADWCQNHITTIENDRTREQEKIEEYNAWVPRANSFYTSLSRLDAMQDILGVSDPNSMAAAITTGLQEAAALGERAQLAHDAGTGETLDVPAVDTSLTSASNEATLAAQQLNAGYILFQQSLLAERRASFFAEGETDRTRLAEIERVKGTVRNIGATVDFSMAVVSGAPGAIANAQQVIAHGEAQLGAYRNRAAISRGQTPRHNPTYLAVGEQGEMVIRNLQTGTERTPEQSSAEGSPVSGAPSLGLGGVNDLIGTTGSSFSLPTSVSDLLGTMTDFIYAGEVEQINRRLAQVQSLCDGVQGAAELAVIRQRAEELQTRLNNFALKCTELQRRMSQRRQTYLEFGIQLDNFARRDAEARQAGVAPGRNEERFATIMVATSQIREVLAVGNGIINGFDSPTDFRVWAQSVESRRNADPPRNDIRTLSTPETEWEPLNLIYGYVTRTNYNIDQVKAIFDGVETAAREMLGRLHQGGGAPDY